MNILCYGDSNTYGYDPRPDSGGRYPADCRWVDILAAGTGWKIQNVGRNGRTIPCGPIVIPEGIDLTIVMLGTNDLLQGNRADVVAARMETFLSSTAPHPVFLIAPPPLQPGEWVTDPAQIAASSRLAGHYRALAGRLGIPFADAGEWDIPLSYDGVHFTEAGHKTFAEKLHKVLLKSSGSPNMVWGRNTMTTDWDFTALTVWKWPKNGPEFCILHLAGRSSGKP